MKSLNRIIFETRLKNVILDLAFYLIVFIFAWLFGKWLEITCYVVTYTVIRGEFTKAVHGKDFTDTHFKGIKYCRYITLGVQIVSVIFLISISLSKYINILLAVVLGVINYFAKDYIETRLRKVVFYKGMAPEELPKDLCGTQYQIMYQYYVEQYKLDKIAYNTNYSVDNVKKIKSKIIKKYYK